MSNHNIGGSMEKIVELIYKDFNQLYHAAPRERDKIERCKEREDEFTSKLNEICLWSIIF